MADLVFGKYEIQHRLAVGGMGEVFYALQKGVAGFERPVILKSLLPDLAHQEGSIDQFLDEARVAATLNHPNVVHIFEVGQWNGTYYLAMEYIRGRNLAQVMRRALEQQRVVPQSVAVQAIREAALGLDHAHRATDASGQQLHIVHRDISPQNLMMRDDGLTKVVDFGIARATNRATRTATGELKGKLAYMAPEQVLGHDVGPAADQFALGIVLWELLAHRRLFKADQDLQLVEKILRDPLPSLSAEVKVEPELEAVVVRMLERDPQRRFASCADVATALERYLSRHPAEVTPREFMASLGTADLVVGKATPSPAGNFVISLKERQAADTKGDRPAPRPRRSPAVVVAVGAALLGLVAAVVVGVSGAKPVESVPTAVAPAPVEPRPPVVAQPQEPVAEPAPAAAKLSVESTPPLSTVRVDGKLLGPTPQALEVSPGQPHYLLVEKPGFARSEQELTLAPGEARTMVVKLEALKTGARPPKPPEPVVAAASGLLSIQTVPWTKVSLNGAPLGSTPIIDRPLPPGRYELEFVNEGAGVRETRSVTIAPGKKEKVILTLAGK